MKALCEGDIFAFLSALARAAEGRNSSMLLQAACGEMDGSTVLDMLDSPTLQASMEDQMSRVDHSTRAHGLQLAARLLRAAPIVLADRLMPLLTTAVYMEVPPLQDFALATLGDVVIPLGCLSARHESSEAVGTLLLPTVQLMSACLYAPRCEMQLIAALALAKLVLRVSNPGAGAGEQGGNERISADSDSDEPTAGARADGMDDEAGTHSTSPLHHRSCPLAVCPSRRASRPLALMSSCPQSPCSLPHTPTLSHTPIPQARGSPAVSRRASTLRA